MSSAVRAVLVALLITALWFVAVYRPLAQRRDEAKAKTRRAMALLTEAERDDSSVTDRAIRERDLIDTVGYTRPTTNAAQEARMVEQLEKACRLSPIGLLEVVRMEPEIVAGPTVTLNGGDTSLDVQYIRYPVQVQTTGGLEGSIMFLSLLRRTNPMMMVDRLVLASSDETGLVRMRCVLSSWRPEPNSLVGEAVE